jgi:hypothetical protein
MRYLPTLPYSDPNAPNATPKDLHTTATNLAFSLILPGLPLIGERELGVQKEAPRLLLWSLSKDKSR